jgi:CheY-like chemotaxis protein
MARSILVVQHDVPAQRHVAACLEEAGYHVIEARTYLDARRTLETRPPDLLITDVRLDGYNGLQLLATSPERVPAIVFTNLPDPVLEADARALGADYLLKPVSRALLLSRVAALLGGLAIEKKTFASRRVGFRTRLNAEVLAQAGGCQAQILELSDRGVRIEIADVAGASLPHLFRLTVPPSGTEVLAKAIWKRRTEAGGWMYGASVSEYDQLAWRAIVDAKTLDTRLKERAAGDLRERSDRQTH